MTNNYFPFGPVNQTSGAASIPYDLRINEANPGIILDPTEPNGVYTVFREVGGCAWWALNADYNSNTEQWEQNSPANAALPAYAIEQCSDGTVNRYVAIATDVPGTAVTWVSVFSIDALGNQMVMPTVADLVSQIAHEIEPTWDAGSSVTMTAQKTNIIDNSSKSDSLFVSLLLNGVPKWQIRKDGTLVTGSIPFSHITGFVLPSGIVINNGDFTGTSHFEGPVQMDSTLTVDGAVTINDDVHATGQIVADRGFVAGGLSPSQFYGEVDFIGGPVHISGATDITDLTVGTLTATGATSLQSVTATSAHITGNETVDGTLTASTSHITGNETVDGSFTAASGHITGNLAVDGDISTDDITADSITANLTTTGDFTASGTVSLPANAFQGHISGTNGVTASNTGSGVALSGAALVQTVDSPDSSVTVSRSGQTVSLSVAPGTPGLIYRVYYRPLDADTFPHTYTLILPTLPGDGATAYDLYAHASVNLDGAANMTLTGGTGSWGSPASQTDNASVPQYIDLAGTATGGQAPSVALYISGLGMEDTPHCGYFILEAVPHTNVVVTNPTSSTTVITGS